MSELLFTSDFQLKQTNNDALPVKWLNVAGLFVIEGSDFF